MSSRKLSDSDKSDILELYRQPGETTLTLASRYGVSSSTISRILKSSLSEDEYETLIQQKRAGRFQNQVSESATDETEEAAVSPQPPRKSISTPKRRLRKRTSSVDSDEIETEEEDIAEETFEHGYEAIEASALQEMLGEDLLDDDELEEEEDEDLEEEDEEDWEQGPLLTTRKPRTSTFVEVLPLSEADLPKICYLVVDKGAELITRPLKEFGDLGKIPAEEFQEKTLPVFDNHRVARRFSARNQRVIKVPDGQMLQKTSSYLQEKGITRLLIDGQVYSL